MPASRISPKSCYSCLSPHLWEKISFMPILGEVCKVLKAWLCSLADPFIWNISTLQEFWRETNFSDYSRIQHDHDVSSPLWTTWYQFYQGGRKSAFQAVSEGQADDGSFSHLLQGQRENVSELMASVTFPCPHLHQKRLISLCCSNMGTGKDIQGQSGGQRDSDWPHHQLGWRGVDVSESGCGWYGLAGWVSRLAWVFFTPAELISSEGYVPSCTTAVFRGA